MTSIATSVAGSLSRSLLERLFQRVDSDRNGSVSAAEIAPLLKSDTAAKLAQNMVAANDGNGDGGLGVDEFPTAALAPETMSGLLSAQEYAALSPDERKASDKAAVDALMARADVDGNGTLSAAEWDAEHVMSLAGSLDASDDLPDAMFLTMRPKDGQEIGRDQILVAHRLDASALQITGLDDDRISAMRDLVKAQAADAPLAEMEPAAAQPGSAREQMADHVRTATFTDTLITRLLMQFGRARATPPTTDITA